MFQIWRQLYNKIWHLTGETASKKPAGLIRGFINQNDIASCIYFWVIGVFWASLPISIVIILCLACPIICQKAS